MNTASMTTTTTSKMSGGLQLIVPGDTLTTSIGGTQDTTIGERGVRNVGMHQDLTIIATMGHNGAREEHRQTSEGMGIAD